MIEVRFHPSVRGISAAFVRRSIQSALKAEKAGGSVSAYVTNNAEIRKINRKHLKHDYATDVISFGAGDGRGDPAGRPYLGDVVVSSEFAAAYSNSHSLSFKEEVARYLVHGTLHLLGYDDRKPADYKKMHGRQEAILKKNKFIRSRSAGDGGRRPRRAA